MILLFIEQQLLYNELPCWVFRSGDHEPECRVCSHHPMAWAGPPMGKNRLRRGWRSRVGKAGQHPQFAPCTAPGPSDPS
jgi:hypothetical protein